MEEIKICPDCGSEIPADSFCDKCGKKFISAVNQDQPPVIETQGGDISEIDEPQPPQSTQAPDTEDKQDTLPGNGNQISSGQVVDASDGSGVVTADETAPESKEGIHIDRQVNIVDASDASGVVTAGETTPESREGIHIGRQVNVVDASGEGIVQVGPGSKATLIKADELKIELESQRLQLHKIEDAQAWEKIQAVFIPPADFSRKQFTNLLATPSKERDDRVFIVYGKPGTGCSSSSIYLGLELFGNSKSPNFVTYMRSPRDTRPLIDLVQSGQVEKDTVYIVSKAFENGVQSAELSKEILPYFQQVLKKNNSYLILTTNDSQVVRQLDMLTFETEPNLSVEQFEQVVDKHLSWYQQRNSDLNIPASLFNNISEWKPEIFSNFQTPNQVDQFFRDLERTDFPSLMTETYQVENPGIANIDLKMLSGEERQTLSKQAMIRFAQHVLDSSTMTLESPRAWFNELSENARLYAMLVGLFENVIRLSLDDIYHLAVDQLRESGIGSLDDPRQFGRDDLLESIRAEENENRSIQFKNPIFSKEVQRQINNRHYLLWTLIEGWGVIIELFQNHEDWELRRSFGAAIGRLGIHYPDKLENILTQLAHHESHRVVSVAGYALDELYHIDPKQVGFVIELLEKWSNSNNHDELWAVAAAVWRVYDRVASDYEAVQEIEQDQPTIVERLWKTLENVAINSTRLSLKKDVIRNAFRATFKNEVENEEILTMLQELVFPSEIWEQIERRLENWAHQNINAVIYAILRIADYHPNDVITNLKSWLAAESDGENKQDVLEVMAQKAGQFLFEKNSKPHITLVDDRHLPLLELILPLVEKSPETAETIIATLLIWIGHPGWAEKIHSALTKVINRGSSKSLVALRFQLVSQWLTSDDAEAIRIGRILITRAYAIDGAPTELSDKGTLILFADASRKGKLGSAIQMGSILAEALKARMDTYTFVMGAAEPVMEPDDESLAMLRTPFAYPRLVHPGLAQLSAIDLERVRSIVITTWGEIIDLPDITTYLHPEKIILTGPNPPDDFDDPYKIITTRGRVTAADFAAIDASIDQIIGLQTTQLEAGYWEQALRLYLRIENPTIDNVMQFFESGAQHLDDSKIAQTKIDSMILLNAGILWLAHTDWDQSIDLISEWLRQPQENVQNYIGRAWGKLLFKTYGIQQPIPDSKTCSNLLDLVTLLTQNKSDWGSVACILHAFENLTTDSHWARIILGFGSEGVTKYKHQRIDWLSKLVENTPNADIHHLETKIKTWKGEDQPDALVQLAERLEMRLALGDHGQFPLLPEGKKYALVLVDASMKRDIHLAEVAEYFSKGVIERNEFSNRFTMITCRLGQRIPMMIKGQAPEASDLLPKSLGNLPNLAGPILDQLDSSTVGFILILMNSPIHDYEDWRENWNHSKIVVCNKPNPRFALPRDIYAFPYRENSKKTAADLANYIQDLVRG
jgi:hypothetical protein